MIQETLKRRKYSGRSIHAPRYCAIIPELTGQCAGGNIRLNELQEQIELMTCALFELRGQGYKKVTFEQVLDMIKAEAPDVHIRIHPEFFKYTGRGFTINEHEFFKWYENTAEGQAYAAAHCNNPLYGRIARIPTD